MGGRGERSLEGSVSQVKGKGKVKTQYILNESKCPPQQYGTSFIEIGWKFRKLC